MRTLATVILPTIAALVVGAVLGVYVLAPIVTPDPTSQPGASPSAGQSEAAADGATGAEGSASPAATIGPGPTGSGASGQPSAAPATPIPAAAEGVVPILYLHRVDPVPAGFAGWSKGRQDDFMVDNTLPVAFGAQLDWLADHGYTTILPRDLAAHWDAGKKLPKRPIILTFDDGFGSWRSTVLPLLQKHGMVAEFYVVVENVGRSISWADIRALAKAGNGIGAHDVHHVQLTGGEVAPASADVMRAEVTMARQTIAANAGVTVDSMAFVGGGYDATLMAIAKAAGYTTARSIDRGVVQSAAARFRLRVSRIGWKDDVLDIYKGRLAPGLPTFAKTGERQGPWLESTLWQGTPTRQAVTTEASGISTPPDSSDALAARHSARPVRTTGGGRPTGRVGGWPPRRPRRQLAIPPDQRLARRRPRPCRPRQLIS